MCVSEWLSRGRGCECSWLTVSPVSCCCLFLTHLSSMDFKANPAADINIDISADKSWNENIGIAEEKLHEVSRIKGEKSKKQYVAHTARLDHGLTVQMSTQMGMSAAETQI